MPAPRSNEQRVPLHLHHRAARRDTHELVRAPGAAHRVGLGAHEAHLVRVRVRARVRVGVRVRAKARVRVRARARVIV